GLGGVDTRGGTRAAAGDRGLRAACRERTKARAGSPGTVARLGNNQRAVRLARQAIRGRTACRESRTGAEAGAVPYARFGDPAARSGRAQPDAAVRDGPD